ncbi:MAG: methylated-DNA--[protein]-cysteine S-methyltransferase [Candidatus Dadabacteria bacterium]|nr:methylated-DNA--[protein]-cysteine S-methyltransferase [Candidatus Dadabacteria bacterium]NIS08256.1 methylated-DNA--[protein]-cysteine S-methyltransferase [Candidatus Dadabacteria bacterium]NIY21741.1 methylated-DNA--[protein]-cysteine S-methyltransferase [Candidatus Dadabacteria bacterium]
MYSYTKLNSNLGDIYVITNSGVLSNLILGTENFKEFRAKNKAAVLAQSGESLPVLNELKSYFDGDLKKFSYRLNLETGKKFQTSVWKELLKIPFGKLVTYKDIANKIGRPNSSRAVGNAVGANPLPIVIPCHRVVSKTGLGGYSCGINYKKKLLKHEGINYQDRFFN